MREDLYMKMTINLHHFFSSCTVTVKITLLIDIIQNTHVVLNLMSFATMRCMVAQF